MKQLKQYAKTLETSAEEPARRGPAAPPWSKNEKLPEVKIGPAEPAGHVQTHAAVEMRRREIARQYPVLGEKNRPPRLAVVENWKSVAEVGLDGKLIAVHKLNLADSEAIGSLRSAAGADGKRYMVAFLIAQQRCHVLDENWNLVASYPEDALQKPHSGIVDVELGDLDGDGKLKMYVSYLGVVGVQAASLEGKRLWTNRSRLERHGHGDRRRPTRKAAAACTAPTARVRWWSWTPKGNARARSKSPSGRLHWIVAADLRGDGQLLWCGLTAAQAGRKRGRRLSLDGQELWNYALPAGVHPQPIEPIISGRLTRQGPGQWILPGPDGSIHVISADGKPWDKFNYGVDAARFGHGRNRRPAGVGGRVGQRAGGVEGGAGRYEVRARVLLAKSPLPLGEGQGEGWL